MFSDTINNFNCASLLKKLLAFFHDHDQLDVSVDSSQYADDAFESLGNSTKLAHLD